jgi:hypothetical protein
MEKKTEVGLIATARAAISDCNWTIGECAVLWCQQYARGRTDADFGAAIGLSGDKVYKCRRVFEAFDNGVSAPVRNFFPKLKWSHFYAALTWDEAAAHESLTWANHNEATVAELKAWHRIQTGEQDTDDSEEPEDDIGTVAAGELQSEADPITLPEHDPAETAVAPFKAGGSQPRDETREAPDKSTRSGKSDLALMRGAWRALRQLCEQVGTSAAIAVCNEATSDIELTDSIEEEDDARLTSLLRSLKETA